METVGSTAARPLRVSAPPFVPGGNSQFGAEGNDFGVPAMERYQQAPPRREGGGAHTGVLHGASKKRDGRSPSTTSSPVTVPPKSQLKQSAPPVVPQAQHAPGVATMGFPLPNHGIHVQQAGVGVTGFVPLVVQQPGAAPTTYYVTAAPLPPPPPLPPVKPNMWCPLYLGNLEHVSGAPNVRSIACALADHTSTPILTSAAEVFLGPHKGFALVWAPVEAAASILEKVDALFADFSPDLLQVIAPLVRPLVHPRKIKLQPVAKPKSLFKDALKKCSKAANDHPPKEEISKLVSTPSPTTVAAGQKGVGSEALVQPQLLTELVCPECFQRWEVLHPTLGGNPNEKGKSGVMEDASDLLGLANNADNNMPHSSHTLPHSVSRDDNDNQEVLLEENEEVLLRRLGIDDE